MLIQKLSEVSSQLQSEGDLITLTPKHAEAISTIPEIVINRGGKLLSLTTRTESLEDIFYRLIKEEEKPSE
jgi:hypothetical protein